MKKREETKEVAPKEVVEGEVTAEVVEETLLSPSEVDDYIKAAYDANGQQRAWLKATLKVFEVDPTNEDATPFATPIRSSTHMENRYAMAIRQMQIAAAERITRILNCDMPPIE